MILFLRQAIAATAVLVAASGTASASSDDAWAELFAKASAACMQASGLKDTSTQGRPVDFDERVLVMVKGTWPQPELKDKPAVFACLYGKTDGRAEAQEMQFN